MQHSIMRGYLSGHHAPRYGGGVDMLEVESLRSLDRCGNSGRTRTIITSLARHRCGFHLAGNQRFRLEC